MSVIKLGKEGRKEAKKGFGGREGALDFERGERGERGKKVRRELGRAFISAPSL